MSSEKKLIQIIDVQKCYLSGEEAKVTALKGVNLTIEKGEFLAIMGPSGSGKSTLMHILGFLDTPTSGTYLFEGKNVTNLEEDELADIRNQKIGFVFQAFNLLPRTSALDNVRMPLIYAGVGNDLQIEKSKKALQEVGLGTVLDHHPNQLSGGQQQRVAIARALINNPQVIFADEPTGNLDSKSGNEIMAIFKELNRKGNTIIMVTHEPDIAAYAKRVLTLKDGLIINDVLNA